MAVLQAVLPRTADFEPRDDRAAGPSPLRNRILHRRHGRLQLVVCVAVAGKIQRDARVEDGVARRRSEVAVDEQNRSELVQIALQALDGNAVIVETKDHRVFRNSSRARFRAASAMFVFLLFGGGRSSNHSGSPRTTALL